MIKHIFWDNDGVLVDTEGLYFQASAEVLRSAGVELTPEAFAEISLRRGESVLALAGHLDSGERDILKRARNARYAELLGRKTQVIAGVEEVLEALYGRIRMAVVTSSRPDHFAIIHRSTGLLRYFDFVLTRDAYTHSKPHPEPYLTALAASGSHPEECLVIEDSERGVAAARAAGIRCLVLPGRQDHDSDFSDAFRVLNSIREVPALVFGPALSAPAEKH